MLGRIRYRTSAAVDSRERDPFGNQLFPDGRRRICQVSRLATIKLSSQMRQFLGVDHTTWSGKSSTVSNALQAAYADEKVHTWFARPSLFWQVALWEYALDTALLKCTGE